jgi:hypothetical protein
MRYGRTGEQAVGQECVGVFMDIRIDTAHTARRFEKALDPKQYPANVAYSMLKNIDIDAVASERYDATPKALQRLFRLRLELRMKRGQHDRVATARHQSFRVVTGNGENPPANGERILIDTIYDRRGRGIDISACFVEATAFRLAKEGIGMRHAIFSVDVRTME